MLGNRLDVQEGKNTWTSRAPCPSQLSKGWDCVRTRGDATTGIGCENDMGQDRNLKHARILQVAEDLQLKW